MVVNDTRTIGTPDLQSNKLLKENPAEPESGSCRQKSLKEWAMEYARKGFRVFPVIPNDKIPVTEDGFYNATTDLILIDRWWDENPKANIGIATGKVVLVVDLDTYKNPKVREELEASGELTETFQVESGGGGLHLYYSISDLEPKIQKKISSKQEFLGILGLDIKAKGGYIIAPPSIHPSGKAYKWIGTQIPATTELTRCPEWLVAKLAGKEKKLVVQKPKSGYQARSENATFFLEQVVEALEYIPANEYSTWLKMGMALHSSSLSGAFEVWDNWSKNSDNYGETHEKWDSFTEDGGITLSSLFKTARDSGWNGKTDLKTEKIDALELDEISLADQFLEKNRNIIRWIKNLGVYFVYNVSDYYWEKDDGRSTQSQTMVRDFLREFQHEMQASIGDSNSEPNARMLRTTKAKLGSNLKIKHLADTLRFDKSIEIRYEEFDTNPELLNVKNGVINLRTGELLKHDARHLMHRQANVSYDKEATAPTFERFLRSSFSNDPETIYYVVRILGYTLTGKISEKCLFMHVGDGNNGKSVLWNLMRYVLGTYSWNADISTFTISGKNNSSAPKPEVVALRGARLITSSEIPERARLNQSFIKDLTGSDTITARGLFSSLEEFEMTGKIHLVGNSLPEFRADDKAMVDRIRYIPWMASIPEEQRDKKLLEKLKLEISGILNILIRGSMEYFSQGEVGQPPQWIQDLTNDYVGENDPITNWIEDSLEKDPSSFESNKALYAAYSDYCELRKLPIPNEPTFGRGLSGRGYQAEKRTISGKQHRGRLGLRIPKFASPF